MEYHGIDYNKTPEENVNTLFNSICIEIVKSNDLLKDKAKELTERHIDLMIRETLETDTERDILCHLAPTWKAIKKQFNKIFKD